MRATSVLDASALLAYLQDEVGADRVEAALAAGCVMSAANWAEVLTKLVDAGVKPDEATRKMTDQGLLGVALFIQAMDEAAAGETATLRPRTRSAGLSLGDRACLALGKSLQLPVLTADRVWGTLELGIHVEAIR